ncbi:MAG: hypothetical protein NVSMB70_16650 [Chamaesiphon sp.]
MTVGFRSWWQKMKRPLLVIMLLTLSVLLIVLLVVEVSLYGTGFAGKTLFDWLNLLGVLAIPIVVGLGTATITAQQSKAQEKAAQKQQYKDALQTFIDTITKLIFEQDLLNAPEGSPARTMAQAQLTMTLSWLIGSHSHKAALLQFMQGANLIKTPNPVISLSPAVNTEKRHNVLNYLVTHWDEVNLSEADLHHACLRQIDLRNADLSKADLSQANLENTNLSGANLNQADLTEANLAGANLNGADLTKAIVAGEQLAKAESLRGAIMPDGNKHP